MVGECINQAGFTNITGVDCSDSMLYQCERKNIYKECYKASMGGDDFIQAFPMILRNKFDFLVAGDLIDLTLNDVELFDTMLLPLKQKGIGIFSVQYSYLGDFWWVDKMAELESHGRIKILDTFEFFKFDQLQSCIGKFTKTPVKVVAFEKLETDSVLQHKRMLEKKKTSMELSTDV